MPCLSKWLALLMFLHQTHGPWRFHHLGDLSTDLIQSSSQGLYPVWYQKGWVLEHSKFKPTQFISRPFTKFIFCLGSPRSTKIFVQSYPRSRSYHSEDLQIPLAFWGQHANDPSSEAHHEFWTWRDWLTGWRCISMFHKRLDSWGKKHAKLRAWRSCPIRQVGIDSC